MRQLSDEDQAEPPLATAAGNSGDLLEEHLHLLDAMRRQELVRLLDEDEGRCGLAVALDGQLVADLLLLLDTALVGYPAEHLVPEWTRLTPRPLCRRSEAARAYLAGYLEREVLEDWAVDFRLAEAGIMTVKRLVNCGAIGERRCRLIVAPLRLVRGVGSPCRVVAVEGELA